MKSYSLVALLLPLAAACTPFGWTYCTDEIQCHDYDLTPGRCLTAPLGPFCALPDKSCTTGWRWDAASRDEYRNKCVDPSIPLDAGVDAGADQNTPGG